MTKAISKKVKEYFRSSDLAKLSNFIFSETIPLEEFDKIKTNPLVIHSNSQTITYINQSFSFHHYVVMLKRNLLKHAFHLILSCIIHNIV